VKGGINPPIPPSGYAPARVYLGEGFGGQKTPF